MVGDKQFKAVIYNKKKKSSKENIYYEPLCETCVHRYSHLYCGNTKHGRAYEDERKKKKIHPYRMDGLFECDSYGYKLWSEDEKKSARKLLERYQKSATTSEQYEVKRSFLDELFDDDGEYDDPWKETNDEDYDS